MLKNIKNELEGPLNDVGLSIDSIIYEKGNLNIVLDSDDIIDLDRIVNATHIINNILDQNEYIKEKYILDVSSKEKGEK